MAGRVCFTRPSSRYNVGVTFRARPAVAGERNARRCSRIDEEATMKTLVAAVLTLGLSVSAFAQSRSVWIEDYTGEEVVAAVGAGKTTLIYCGGALHADGPAIAVGKHMRVAPRVAQRVAEELGNALVLP